MSMSVPDPLCAGSEYITHGLTVRPGTEDAAERPNALSGLGLVVATLEVDGVGHNGLQSGNHAET